MMGSFVQAFLWSCSVAAAQQVLKGIDWIDSRVADDPVLPSTTSLDACVALCQGRRDCVAVSWNQADVPSPERPLACSLKCAARAQQELSAPGHLAVVVRPGETSCPLPSWYPEAWNVGITSGSLLLSGPEDPGAHVGNGYVAAWIKNLHGSSGPIQTGIEHVAGVFAGRVTAVKPEGCISWCDRAHKADLPSMTSTATIVQIGSESVGVASASGLDLKNGAYRRAFITSDKLVTCEQMTYAHRSHMHLLITEFECKNHGQETTAVKLEQPGPRPLPAPTAELVNQSVAPPAQGVSCTRMTVKVSETESSPKAVIGECHSDCDGASFAVASGQIGRFSCVSARYTSVDSLGSSVARDPAESAKWAWLSADASSGTLWAEHVAAMNDQLWQSGIELEGDEHLVRVTNASMAALMNTYRADVFFGGSSSGGLPSDAYGGGTGGGWDIETWQWPVLNAFYPDIARAVLQYRIDRQDAAAANAKAPSGGKFNVSFDGLMYPWMSALSGVEQNEVWPTEDHINGDIALAFDQYWQATRDQAWLRSGGFSVLEGIARFWASKAALNKDGSYSIHQTQSPDEYRNNVTDAVFNNYIAKRSLEAAFTLAELAGVRPNATFKHIADGLVLLYDAERDYHPEFLGYNDTIIKQADVALLYYPLEVETAQSTQRHDLERYASLTDPDGPAMTWMIHSVGFGDLGDAEAAAKYFKKSYDKYVRGPFFVWHENAVEGGVPNFINGAGGLLQNIINGYGGLRWRHGSLVIQRPRPPPNCTALTLRRVSFLGARITVRVTELNFTLTLVAAPVACSCLQVTLASGISDLKLDAPVVVPSSDTAWIALGATCAHEHALGLDLPRSVLV